MSNIKGGGRAELSEEAEEAILSLLYDIRDHKNPLISGSTTNVGDKADDEIKNGKKKKPFMELSDHDKKKERKKFLKRLLENHNKLVLHNRLNKTPSPSVNQSRHISTSGVGSNGSNTQVNEASKKVRIELVEAIFAKEKKAKPPKEKKDKKKSSKKEKKSPAWKEGSVRKTLVLSRTTTAKDLIAQCKAKLKMKKPNRIFFLDKETNLEADINDLSGVHDGAVLYATSFVPPTKDNADDGEEEKRMDDGKFEKSEEEAMDPLESIKKAYRICSTNKGGNRQAKLQFKNERLPFFTGSLNKLEKLSEARAKLPASRYRSDILKSLDSSRVIVISGATGCGKSTQIPQFVLEGMKAIGAEDQTNIIVTQPRRVAAMSLAKRVSEERNLPPPGREGSQVGYNVRLAKATSKETKIIYCTVGVLLRMIVNPMESYGDEENEGSQSESQSPIIPLTEISTCIIDEIHERDLTTDFALTLLRPILAVNKRISIILMSATASSQLFVDYFRDMKMGIEPQVFNIPGRTFPVETKWLVDCEKVVSGRMNGWAFEKERLEEVGDARGESLALSPRATTKIDIEFIAKLVKSIALQQWNDDAIKDSKKDKESGSMLIFLPGKGEIEALSKQLHIDPKLGNKSICSILQLHSMLTPSEQWRAFQPVKNGLVKIVLSTNVSETSITIPDISVVIDTGRVKEMQFNSSTRIKELVTVWTSQASSKQRAGRGGRTGPGICYKLYSEEFFQIKMPRQTSPEIMRTPLEELVLQVCLLEEQKSAKGISPVEFLSNAPEAPPKKNLEEACSHLLEIGALSRLQGEVNDMYRLTPLGYHLSHLPMDAKVGKILVVGCIFQCIEPALTVAAVLSATKSCWFSFIPGVENSRSKARSAQEDIISNGFGGPTWRGGNVEGDLIASIAAYNAWSLAGSTSKSQQDKQRRRFARDHGLDHNALTEIKGLRTQFKASLRISGLLQTDELDNIHSDDALLTSCSLVAGLYPNIASVVRPSKERRIRGGQLITKSGDLCRPSSSSFQCERIRNIKEGGKDAYVVYLEKHATSNTVPEQRKQSPFLNNINFVPKFAILLFGGNIDVCKNCLVVDEWLKFKVDDLDTTKSSKLPSKGEINAVMINELRKELDRVLLRRIMKGRMNKNGEQVEDECERVIQVVKQLLLSG